MIKLGPNVTVADQAYVQENRGDIFELIGHYFDKSKDTSSTPAKVMIDIMKRVGEPKYFMAVHEEDGKLNGFLIGNIVAGPVARILFAFLDYGLDNKVIIKDALAMFDDWAKSHGCIASDLYTHRHPKSYRNLKELGWRHNYTVYRRDYK